MLRMAFLLGKSLSVRRSAEAIALRDAAGRQSYQIWFR